LSEGVPRSFTLNSNEYGGAWQDPLQGIVGAVNKRSAKLPARLGADGRRARHRAHRGGAFAASPWINC